MSAMSDTPSQRWTRRKGACARGRRDLGWKSIGEYYRTSRHMSNLLWILFRLTESTDESGIYKLPEWITTLESTHTPKSLRALAHANGVMIPLELS